MKRRPLRLLAIDLTAKGFGFVLPDAKLGLLDWGFCAMPAADDTTFLARVTARIERGRPTALVLENFAPTKSRETATRRCSLVIALAEERQIGLCQVSRKVVQGILGQATKADIAAKLTTHFPELTSRLPAKRKQWNSEDERMHIFDALALAVVVMVPRDRGATER
jgi:hypothetical protein